MPNDTILDAEILASFVARVERDPALPPAVRDAVAALAAQGTLDSLDDVIAVIRTASLEEAGDAEPPDED